jgi:hypothetical protein
MIARDGAATVNGCYCLELDGAQKILFEKIPCACFSAMRVANEWEVLKEVARQFPDLGNGNLILLDEYYVPFGKKNYMDSNYKPLNEEADPK